MMARPEKPITADGPAATFATKMRRARYAAGNPKYRAMAARSGYSHTALSQAARGERLPSWECVQAYLRACGVTDEAEFKEWQGDWESTRRAVQLRRATEIGVHDRGGRPETPAAPASPISTLPNFGQSALPVPARAAMTLLTTPAVWHDITDSATDRPVSSKFPAPSPSNLTTVAELVMALNEAVTARGQTLRELYGRIVTSTLPKLAHETGAGARDVRDALTGRRPPTQRVILRVVDACGGTEEDKAAWVLAYQHVYTLERRARTKLDELKQQVQAEDQVASPAAPPDPDPPTATRNSGVHRASGLEVRLVLMYLGAGTLAMALGAVLTLLIQQIAK